MKLLTQAKSTHTWQGILSRLRVTLQLSGACLIDFWNYARYCWVSPYSADARNLSALLLAHAHVIEKGINHPAMRPGFGADRINELIRILTIYKERGHNWQDWSVHQALNALHAYAAAHDSKTPEIKRLLTRLAELGECGALTGGTTSISRDELARLSQAPYEEFAWARHSIRHYTDQSVDPQSIKRIVELARAAPSSCNRQGWHVYATASATTRASIVALHEGCRGFGQNAPMFFVVTTDRRLYMGARERNQCYVDGGIFTMSLLHAIHHYELGACVLNWAAMPGRDRALKRALQIPPSEAIIVIISVGHPLPQSEVPLSTRKPVEDSLTII